MFGTRWLLARLADHSQQYYKQLQLQPQEQPLLTLTPSKNECKLFALQDSSYVIARLDPFRLSVEPTQKPECVPIFYAGVVKRAIRNAFMAIEFDKADTLYTTVNRWYLAENFAALRQYWCEHHRSAGKKQIKTLLSAYDFAQAYLVAERYAPVLHSDDYLPTKRSYVQQYFEQRYQTALNDEQLTSLISSSHNVLLTARAGSGKTRVIVCKTALQIAYGALPDQILLLAFNKKAADEMATRLQKEFNFPNFATARTFHSLAYQLARPTKKLVSDEQSQLKLISTALKSIKDKRFMALLKEFLTSSDLEDDAGEMKKDDPAYLTYRRNLFHITLSGVAVKSDGEKWIADFLFEQGIGFEYEKIHLANGHPYRPDFTLRNLHGETVILEHWGVSSVKRDDDTIFDGNTTAGAYRAQMRRKRQYWQSCNTVLIESSVDDMHKGREFFTNQLANKLNAAGIIGHPLSVSELLEKLEKIHLNRFEQLLRHFIERAKNQQLTSLDIHKLLQRLPSAKRIRTFWHLAYQLFCAYEQILLDTNQIDYSDMLGMAAKQIDATKGHCYIQEEDTRRLIWIDQLQWLLIDEFQDFTPGFDLMVQAMRRNNPQLRLYCVGDDWQAINGFAGSDLAYFRAFSQKIEHSAVLYLQMNQRSQQVIVKAGNQRFLVAPTKFIVVNLMILKGIFSGYLAEGLSSMLISRLFTNIKG